MINFIIGLILGEMVGILIMALIIGGNKMIKYNFNFEDYKNFCKRFDLKPYKYDSLRYFKLVCTCE